MHTAVGIALADLSETVLSLSAGREMCKPRTNSLAEGMLCAMCCWGVWSVRESDDGDTACSATNITTYYVPDRMQIVHAVVP